MQAGNNVYKLSDKAAELLNKKAIRRFEKAKSKANLLKFDELSILEIVKSLYSGLNGDNQRVFLDLADEVYGETKPRGKKEPDEEWLLLLLEEYDPITKYVYENEVERKRDRTAEAINASTEKSKEFKRGLLYWGQMTAQYADIVTDHARVKAFKDAGVKKVRWHTQEDEKVCEVCKARDKKVYPISQIPPKPHWGCRCWLSAVIEI